MRRNQCLVEAAAIIIVGALLHFTYAWSGGNPVVGFVSPVNESVWEHTKLLVVPLLAIAAAQTLTHRDRRRLAWGALAGSVAGAVTIIAIFYTYTGALGVDSILWVDIGSFVVAVVIGQLVKWRILTSAAAPAPVTVVSLGGLTVLSVIYVWGTLVPPDVPLFRLP